MKKPELIYWKGSGEVRSDLLQAIKVVGYELNVVTDIDEVHHRSPDNFPGIIVVDASAGEAEASQRVIEVSALQRLVSVPFIFLSYQATKRSAVLKKTFTKFLPIDIPFKLQDVLQRFLELCPVEVPQKPEAKPEAGAPAVPQAEVERVERDLSSARGPERPRAASLVVKPVPEHLAEQLSLKNSDPSKISSGHGGEFLALGSRLDKIDDNALLPEHPQREMLVRALNVMTSKSEWLGLHARRVSFLSSAIAHALGLDEERDRIIRTTGLILNWGLRESYHSTLSHDLLLSPEDQYIDAIVRGYQESARFARENVQDEPVAQMIEDIMAILLKGDDGPQNESLINAHCALVPELADRCAWSKQKWDAHGTHRAVRKFFTGEPFLFDREVVMSASRALSEAAAIRLLIDPMDSFERTDETDATLVADAEDEATRLFQLARQLSVELPDLRPGMRLSRPLVSWDGKLLLRANTSLDEEIIIRLWRLSTIRPMRLPVAIVA